MITHVIVKLDAPIEEKYWEDDDIFSNEYYGLGKPLIRCKDCKHYYEKEWVVGGGSYTTCWYQTIANAQPNDFCSRAERKEE